MAVAEGELEQLVIREDDGELVSVGECVGEVDGDAEHVHDGVIVDEAVGLNVGKGVCVTVGVTDSVCEKLDDKYGDAVGLSVVDGV